jgi:1-acyl-sn-glycerol-3-phosphate acyltransferase
LAGGVVDDMDEWLTLSAAPRSSSACPCWCLEGLEGFSALQVCMALFAAHTFLVPGALVSGVCVLAWLGGWARVASVALVVGYACVSFDGAERVGLRVAPGFVRWWRQTHSFFPVTLKLWHGSGWSTEPCAAHKAVYGVLSEDELARLGGPGAHGEQEAGSGVSGRRFIFGLHPHGPVPLAASVLLPQLYRWPWLVRRLRVGVASAVFNVPFLREFYTVFGSVDASRRVLDGLLDRGLSIVLLPGGIREQLKVCEDDEEVIVLRNRKGFVRLALQHGASLVPVFGFGERKGYRTSRALNLLSHWLRRFCKAGVPAIRGQWCSLMPWPSPLTIVFGQPIPVPRVPEPSDQQVDELHARYVDAVAHLYETHKHDAGYDHVQLKIL